MIKKLLFSSFFLFLLHSAVFAQEEEQQMRDPQLISTAEQLTEDLSNRLSLTEEQSDEIKEILIDFQENIVLHKADADEAETYRNETEYDTDYNTGTEDVITDTETQTDIETETETTFPPTDSPDQIPPTTTEPDVLPPTDTDVDVDADVRTDFPENDVDVDMRANIETENPQDMANQAIEDVLNESQMVTWNVIKEAWWRDVSNRYGWDLDNK